MATAPYRPDYQRRAAALAEVLTQAQLSSLIGVSRSAVSRWVSGTDTPRGNSASTLVDLEFVVTRYSLAYPSATFRDWFGAPNPFLNGAAPADVFHLEGPSRVVDALTSEIAGSYP